MNHSEEFLSPEDIAVLKRTLLQGYTEDEQESFIRLCQRTRLDPFSKQIYATRRYNKDRQGNKIPTLVPVTSVIGLTAIAARTGHYDGCVIQWAGTDHVWKDEWLEEGFPLAAKCVVYHKQRTYPEVGIAHWAGYCGQTYNPATKRWEVSDFWERLGPFMLGKCAKAQAFRGAFPDQCSNLYITEELQGGVSEADQHDDEAKITANRAKEAELLKTASGKGFKVVESKPVPRPTPAEAAEPAEPSKPVTAPPPEVQSDPQEPDDLDMSGPSIEDEPPPSQPAQPPTWKTHVIKGLKNPRFYKRLVGDLSVAELQAIETQWLPKVRPVWDQVNSLQKADAGAFEAALAFHKMNPLG